MTDLVTAQTIYQHYHASLLLRWHYGQQVNTLSVHPEQEGHTAFAGFFNNIHPHQIVVFGTEELAYLQSLASRTLSETLETLFNRDPLVLLVAGDQAVPNKLLARAKRHRTPVMSSPLPGQALIDKLNQDLASHFAESKTIHGVFMDVLGVGVLLTGVSGIGKSELALGLINCGHRLIADDAVIFTKHNSHTLYGNCPPTLQDFLEVRGLGIINIRAMFGDNAIKESKRLQLIVKVVAMSHDELQQIDRLEGIHSLRRILDIDIPEVTIPVAPGRNLAVLIEGAVRNQILKLTGYEASKEFIQRQMQQITDAQNH